MRKDFTIEQRNRLIALINEINDEQWFGWTDCIGDMVYGFQEFIGVLDIDNYYNNVEQYHKRIMDKNDTTISQLKDIFEAVWGVDETYQNKVKDHRSEYYSVVQEYIKSLTEIIMYGNQSFNAASMDCKLGSLEEILNQRVNNPIVNEHDYGGNQGSARYNVDEVKEIVRRYYPEYDTDEKVRGFLEEMNSKGCGFVALINTVFLEFVGREDEFERIFGFPMYKPDGTLNYDKLLVDFYCSQNGPKTNGLSISSRKTMWEKYMEKYDIDVTVDTYVDVTPENYDELSENGQIIIAIHPLRLRDEDGVLVDKRDGRHAMTVVGLTEDGMYIVASWGRKYYIDPNDYEDLGGDSYMNFNHVRYE